MRLVRHAETVCNDSKLAGRKELQASVFEQALRTGDAVFAAGFTASFAAKPVVREHGHDLIGGAVEQPLPAGNLHRGRSIYPRPRTR